MLEATFPANISSCYMSSSSSEDESLVFVLNKKAKTPHVGKRHIQT